MRKNDLHKHIFFLDEYFNWAERAEQKVGANEEKNSESVLVDIRHNIVDKICYKDVAKFKTL